MYRRSNSAAILVRTALGALLAAPLLCALVSLDVGAQPDPETQAFLDQLEGKPPQERIRALKMRADEGKPTKEIWFHLGTAFYETNNVHGAIQAFENAVGLDPTYLKAMVNLALMYDEDEKWAKAIETFERASELDPENPDVWSNMGNTYYAQGKYGDAVGHYRMALAINPDATHALYQMGIAFADAGIFREAVRYWSRVSQLEPDSEIGRSAGENVELLQKYLIPE